MNRTSPKIITLLLTLSLLAASPSVMAQRTRGPLPPSHKVIKGGKALRPAVRYIKANRGQLRALVKKNGGPVEIHREGKYRLMVTDSGKFAYQRVDQQKAKVHRVLFTALFPHGKFPSITDKSLMAQLKQKLEAKREAGKAAEKPAEKPMAILPDGKKVASNHNTGGFHGTGDVKPEVALRQGLPGRGSDWRLKEHSEAAGNSAYRGVTAVVADPVSQNGAAYWAGEGGWVYDIRGVPGWDVNSLLQGRVPTLAGGFRGNLMHGEQEVAIPARVPPEKIKAYGKVVHDSSGRPRVKEWIPNPAYKGPK